MPGSENSIDIAILGATGPVGQRVISMVEAHPKFRVAEVAGSTRSEGKVYGEVVHWTNEMPLPDSVAALTVKSPLEVKSKYVISALPAESAIAIEPALADRGQFVFSNASAMRMEANVPLIIPEINADHLSLIEKQKTPGSIVTNPNCSTVFLALALAPLRSLGKFTHVNAVTLQALSGAGYPGVASFDLLGNIIPHIGGEEEKIVREAKKILGTAEESADFPLTVHVHRVPVVHGHTVALHVHFADKVNIATVREAFLAAHKEFPEVYKLHEACDRPQPARDLYPHDQRVHIGRLKQGDSPNVIGLISMGHNLVRGAAGAALGNLEAFLQRQGDI